MAKKKKARKPNRYQQIISYVFFKHYKEGDQQFGFERSEMIDACEKLAIKVPSNIGDVPYSFRYRYDLPADVMATADVGREWIIEGAGDALYEFKLVKESKILPRSDLAVIKIPDATPEIINKYILTDEQALLAKLRYNRLIDIFLGVTAYSLQNHLRTKLQGIGQLEIDEVYVGVNKRGSHFVIPVQAKGGADKIGVVQSKQDIAWCAAKLPDLICRAISAQFLDESRIAIFEITVEDDEVKVVEEKHYQLVLAGDISSLDLNRYRATTG